MQRRHILPIMAFVVGALVLAVVAAMMLPTGKDRSAGNASIGGSFSLTDQNGKTITEASLAGAPYMVFFGFTHCPDICPTKLFEMTEILNATGEKGKSLRALFVSVDPERDTVDVMKSYLGSFDQRIIGLTGGKEQVDAMVKAYRAYYRKVPTGGDDYTMDHTAIVYLMGKNGEFIGVLNVERPPAEAAAELLRQL